MLGGGVCLHLEGSVPTWGAVSLVMISHPGTLDWEPLSHFVNPSRPGCGLPRLSCRGVSPPLVALLQEAGAT